jgi:signal transduction histidine kinase
MHSLRWKLGGALVLMVLLSVALVAGLTYMGMTREFRHYVSRGSSIYADRLENGLARFYAREGSWDGVQQVMEMLMIAGGNSRLVLADGSGTVVGDTGDAWLGWDVGELGLDAAMSIAVGGEEVGELYLVLPAETVTGRGFRRGMTGIHLPGAGDAVQTDALEQDFLSSVNRSLWLAILIAAGVAVILGLALTRRITRPLQALAAGARHIARGELGHRVEVSSRDEVGELAESFNAMARSLDENEQARRRLMADIAHELATPLTVIEGTVDGILDGVFQPDAEHLGSVKEQTALLTRLISDLRDISLAESGQLKLERAPTDLVELVRRKVSQAELAAGDKDIRLEFEAALGLPVVNVDAGRMEQVVANLIANAVRHTPSGGSITVSARTAGGDAARQVDGPSLLLSVADTGEGIAPEHLPHVFERFYRAEGARSRAGGGAGLGLAIVKQMVQAHGGRVWVDSQPGRGSTFYVALPLRL